jgi:hypothetical protein
MAVLLGILSVSLAIATFIENDHGTIAARATVYNAWWFEVLLGLLVINLTGNIILRKLYQKRKFTIFLFHIAFSFILTRRVLNKVLRRGRLYAHKGR